jgi:hypothetical protein
MSYYADLVDKLAVDVLAAAEELDDDRLPETIAQAIGASSPTTEELFRTAIRVRMAEARARRLLADRLAAARQSAQASEGNPAPPPPPETGA